MKTALLNWDATLIDYISSKCVNLQKCEVVTMKDFKPELILKLPKTVSMLDFDGELMKRGRLTKPLLFDDENPESWLPQAQTILKALQILRTPPIDYSLTSKSSCLTEVHLSTVKASATDLKPILQNCPNLNLLRHYQMVTALYELHSDAWKKKLKIPKYNLKNLDVDFSHVVRCTMSPKWVLPPDALQLAVTLCPSAHIVHVRFDCSTPHDVLHPLTSLKKLQEFSAVCVSSGERTLLDFSDMVPILEAHGQNGLNILELKVIEEVEIHIIIENCTNLESLVLSGCGYITPSTCSTFGCHKYDVGSFKKLQCLFYADGDDFSWDHGVPDCFWKATLYPSRKTREVKLQGLFLEFPRFSSAVFDEIFNHKTKKPNLSFPHLKVLSLCRCDEITVEDIAWRICGLTGHNKSPNESLQYLRFSECANVRPSDGKRLGRWMKVGNMKVKIHVDG
ncbi:hypothetical protein RUM43_009497 [Polyplax serrata]|uniref:Uncharacterized protein n=1 Tax=Polyplax serrata TaxID=468196 RepID=A0AAN8S4K0_POLSC